MCRVVYWHFLEGVGITGGFIMTGIVIVFKRYLCESPSVPLCTMKTKQQLKG